LNQIVAYPLREYDGTLKTMDWRNAPKIASRQPVGPRGETRWVMPEKFFDDLCAVLDSVPPLPGEEALYGQFRALMDARATDAAIKQALDLVAVATEREVIEPFFEWRHNGRPAGNGWNRSTNNARWGTDYFNRTGTAKSNIFDNNPDETEYFYTDTDSTGSPLDGRSSYEISFAAGQEPPVSGFWSLTLYNSEHLFHPNPLHRFSLGTKNKNLMRGDDGSLTLYAGARSPGQRREANWLPAPERHFSLYIRAYWGQPPILDGSWKPPVVRKIAWGELRTR
jgi:hypothetical protein